MTTPQTVPQSDPTRQRIPTEIPDELDDVDDSLDGIDSQQEVEAPHKGEGGREVPTPPWELEGKDAEQAVVAMISPVQDQGGRLSSSLAQVSPKREAEESPALIQRFEEKRRTFWTQAEEAGKRFLEARAQKKADAPEQKITKKAEAFEQKEAKRAEKEAKKADARTEAAIANLEERQKNTPKKKTRGRKETPLTLEQRRSIRKDEFLDQQLTLRQEVETLKEQLGRYQPTAGTFANEAQKTAYENVRARLSTAMANLEQVRGQLASMETHKEDERLFVSPNPDTDVVASLEARKQELTKRAEAISKTNTDRTAQRTRRAPILNELIDVNAQLAEAKRLTEELNDPSKSEQEHEKTEKDAKAWEADGRKRMAEIDRLIEKANKEETAFARQLAKARKEEDRAIFRNEIGKLRAHIDTLTDERTNLQENLDALQAVARSAKDALGTAKTAQAETRKQLDALADKEHERNEAARIKKSLDGLTDEVLLHQTKGILEDLDKTPDDRLLQLTKRVYEQALKDRGIFDLPTPTNRLHNLDRIPAEQVEDEVEVYGEPDDEERLHNADKIQDADKDMVVEAGPDDTEDLSKVDDLDSTDSDDSPDVVVEDEEESLPPPTKPTPVEVKTVATPDTAKPKKNTLEKFRRTLESRSLDQLYVIQTNLEEHLRDMDVPDDTLVAQLDLVEQAIATQVDSVEHHETIPDPITPSLEETLDTKRAAEETALEDGADLQDPATQKDTSSTTTRPKGKSREVVTVDQSSVPASYVDQDEPEPVDIKELKLSEQDEAVATRLQEEARALQSQRREREALERQQVEESNLGQEATKLKFNRPSPKEALAVAEALFAFTPPSTKEPTPEPAPSPTPDVNTPKAVPTSPDATPSPADPTSLDVDTPPPAPVSPDVTTKDTAPVSAPDWESIKEPLVARKAPLDKLLESYAWLTTLKTPSEEQQQATTIFENTLKGRLRTDNGKKKERASIKGNSRATALLDAFLRDNR